MIDLLGEFQSLCREVKDGLRRFKLAMVTQCFAGPGEIDFLAMVSTKLSLLEVNVFHLPLGEFV